MPLQPLRSATLDAHLDATDVTWRVVRDDLVRAYADHGVTAGPYVTRLRLAQTQAEFRDACRANAALMSDGDA